MRPRTRYLESLEERQQQHAANIQALCDELGIPHDPRTNIEVIRDAIAEKAAPLRRIIDLFDDAERNDHYIERVAERFAARLAEKQTVQAELDALELADMELGRIAVDQAADSSDADSNGEDCD